MKRTVSGIVLMLLLMAMFSLAFNIKPTKAEWTGTVYIRADGSIDPPYAPIETYDNITYTLTGDIIITSGDGIVVERDNIVFDGACYTIYGAGDQSLGAAMRLHNRVNVTIMNLEIRPFYTYYNFAIGFDLYNASEINIIRNNITETNAIGFYLFWAGINLSGCSNITIAENNIFSNGGAGIYVSSSLHCSILGNNIRNNEVGIHLSTSSNNTITGNSLTQNKEAGIALVESSNNNNLSENMFFNDGLSVEDSYENVIVGNMVNGEPLIYLENVSDIRVEEPAGQVILVNSLNITVEGLNLSNTNVGIQLWKTNNTKISSNSMANNDVGISLGNSFNNDVARNTITANNWAGIRLSSSHDNRISENNMTTNGYGKVFPSIGRIPGAAIMLFDSTNNTITENNVNANIGLGIWLDSSSNNNIVRGNKITYNSGGIWIGGSGYPPKPSNNNIISGNEIAKNKEFGVGIAESSDNIFYHNNFTDNPCQVTCGRRSINIWDDGYPSGGNYWSDYTGVDLFGGPYQNMTGGDGIGDTPYIIDANNQDRYPLMAPFSTFEAGVWDGTAYNVDVLSNSTVSDFKFDVDNKSISLKVTGDNGTVGFCRVAIPKSLLWTDDGWTIFVDNQPITDYTKFEYENYTYLYFTYTHSTKTVTIKGTHVIPEYPSTIIPTIFMLMTTVLAVVTKKRRLFMPRH
jgi:parallel beta-helix repeat protein